MEEGSAIQAGTVRLPLLRAPVKDFQGLILGLRFTLGGWGLRFKLIIPSLLFHPARSLYLSLSLSVSLARSLVQQGLQ